MNKLVEYKIAILGQGGVGKSAITIQLINRHFVEDYDPTIEDSYRKPIQLDQQTFLLDILDTAGGEAYNNLRDSYMKEADGFLIVYAINSRSSFDEVSNFYEQIKNERQTNKNPTIIVGNKVDLDGQRKISQIEGQDLAKSLNCLFIESSAKTRVNIEEPFCNLTREINKLYPNNIVVNTNRKVQRCAVF
ncbi:ras-like protein rasd [Anaeramoeba flamelloides]|uniref:Ras-like protein rasd n=1 Tax=Anaeramoeba flamelloides TaxID=1746091 RepID=A0ABQ8YNS4_9EUKA|nr:ras-like protein rasd [Anaeramoeba flamelloides]